MTADTDTAKRGRGQPKKGRTADLPRIHPDYHAKLVELTAAKGPYLADTLERLIERAGITNATDKFLIVGDFNLILGAHDTATEAEAYLAALVPDPEDPNWQAVRILGPGETDTKAWTLPLPLTAKQKERIAAGESLPRAWIV